MDGKSYVSGSHAIWENIQIDSFKGWINQHLQERNLQIKDLSTDFCDGVMLINLLEIVSGKKVPRYVRSPKFPSHKIDNVLIALQFMEKVYDIKTVGINAKDIVDGNMKQIMGVSFMLIQKIKTNDLEHQHQQQHQADGADTNTAVSSNASSSTPTPTPLSPSIHSSANNNNQAFNKRATIVGTAVSRFASKTINDIEIQSQNANPTTSTTTTTTTPSSATASPVTTSNQQPNPRATISNIPTGGVSINTIRSRFTSVPPTVEAEKVATTTKPISDPSAPIPTSQSSGSLERGALRKTKSGAIISLSGSIQFNNKESTIDLKKLVLCQAYVRGWLVRRKWRDIIVKYRQRLREYETHFKTNAKAYRGLTKVQARIKGKMERKRLWRQYPLFRRNDIVKEILSTERKYVHNLDLLIECYLRECEKILSPQQTRSIFSQIEIIRNVNTNILNQLENRFKKGHEQQLGEIFKKMTEFLKVYTIYVNNYNTSFATITECNQIPKFAALMETNRNLEKCNGLDLSAFLIMPIQRLPRYVLLLQDLFKHTDDKHPDYENISIALKKMKDVAEYVNEKKREAENLNQVLQIQNSLIGKFENLAEPHRRYVRKGPLSCSDEKGKVYFFFLFNDLLVKTENKTLAKQIKDNKAGSRGTLTGPIGGEEGKFKFITSYHLDGASLIDLFDPASPSSFQLLNVGISKENLGSSSGSALMGGSSGGSTESSTTMTHSNITLTALSVSEKLTWIADIDESISQLLEKARSKKRSHIPEFEELTRATYEGPIKDSEMSGVLLKQKTDLVWKQNQFYLKGANLYYHNVVEESNDTTKPKKLKCINLILCNVKLFHVADKPHCFQLITPLRIYFFSCPEGQSLFLWISLIRSSISKKLESLSELDETTQANEVLSEPSNQYCADCGATDPSWISTSFGVVLCVDCSAIHRHLPNGVSQVKSLRGLSTSHIDLEAFKFEGNAKANAKYEKNIPAGTQRPTSKDSPYEIRMSWIHAKYLAQAAPGSPSEMRKASIKISSGSFPPPPPLLSASISTTNGINHVHTLSASTDNNNTTSTNSIPTTSTVSVSSSSSSTTSAESSTQSTPVLASQDSNTTTSAVDTVTAANDNNSSAASAAESQPNPTPAPTTERPSEIKGISTIGLSDEDIATINNLPSVPSGSGTWKSHHHAPTVERKKSHQAFLDKPRIPKKEIEGFMYKTSSPSTKSSAAWKKYHFQFKDGILNYYKVSTKKGTTTTTTTSGAVSPQKKDKPRGTIDLCDFFSIKVEPKPKQEHSFTLITRYRLYFFATDTEEELGQWVSTLKAFTNSGDHSISG